MIAGNTFCQYLPPPPPPVLTLLNPLGHQLVILAQTKGRHESRETSQASDALYPTAVDTL